MRTLVSLLIVTTLIWLIAGYHQADALLFECTICGDVNGDLFVANSDVHAFRESLADPNGSPLSTMGQTKCNVIGDVRLCDILDVVVLRRALAAPPRPPGIAPACEVVVGPEGGCPALPDPPIESCLDDCNCAPIVTGLICQKAVGQCLCQGTCQPPEQVELGTCNTAVQPPVCGCDGNTYPGPCAAAIVRVNIDHYGSCE